jgi:lipoate-protein ligase B
MDERMEIFSSQNLEVQDWGLVEYGEAFLRQKTLVEECITGVSPDHLVLVEHPPVVTIGRSGDLEDLQISKQALHQKGVALHPVDRGGMTTFHGPKRFAFLFPETARCNRGRDSGLWPESGVQK